MNHECENFRIGDVVQVSLDMMGGHDYGSLFFNPRMKKYIGGSFIIKDYDGFGYYKLQSIEDDSDIPWKWNDEMLCSVEDNEKEIASEDEVDSLLM